VLSAVKLLFRNASAVDTVNCDSVVMPLGAVLRLLICALKKFSAIFISF